MSINTSEQQEVIADIHYLESLIAIDEAQIKSNIIQRISLSSSIEDKIDIIGGEVAHHLGRLSARIAIIEKVLANNENFIEFNKTSLPSNNLAADTELPIKNLTLSADQFPKNDNLYHLENSNGIVCRWTGPATTTDFYLLIDRSVDHQLKIGIVGVIKPELLKKITLVIDGIKIKYRLSYIDGVNYLTSLLPAIKSEYDQTKISLALPHVFSPNELNGSSDFRKLGIALASIAVIDGPNIKQRIAHKFL